MNSTLPTTILIVDDEENVRDMLHEVLKGENVQILEAEGVKEALDKINKRRDIDLLITDMVMPGKSGEYLLTKMKERKYPFPVIIISGDPSIEAAVRCIKLGATNYITKPFGILEFDQLVSQVINTHREKKKGRSSTFRSISLLPVGQYKKLADYEVKQILGTGSMGIVFLVEKMVGGSYQEFALKILKTDFSVSNKERNWKRFITEAKIVQKLNHKNIIKIIEFGTTEDNKESVPYMVMEYIRGSSLKEVIKEGSPLSYAEKANIIISICSALEVIHEQGICHRDIKPANILVTEDREIKVADFGIARIPGGSGLTASGELIGTPPYLSPEAFLSPKVTSQSDIFSLGITAYELFLGERPFQANNLLGFAHAIRNKEPKSPKIFDPDFPDALQDILEKMLKKNQSERYSSVKDVARDIGSFLERCDDASSPSI